VPDAIPTLVCTCGNVMKAPGAKPGRVGKCTKCGALIRVQGEAVGAETASAPLPSKPTRAGPTKRSPAPASADQGPDPSRPSPILPSARGYGITSERVPESSFRHPTGNEPHAGVEARPVQTPDVGPVKGPIKLESRFSQSLRYPLWSWSSIGLLGFLPPMMVFTTSPLTFLAQSLFSDSAFVFPAYVSLIPVFFFMFVTVGYACIYLGNILIATANGEILPPRPPGLDDELPRVMRRWSWALISGFVVGGVPAAAYWINCGEVDWMDRLMFLNLTILGVAYAQLALLSVLLHDDPLAANPITVMKAMLRLGVSYVRVCAFTLSALCRRSRARWRTPSCTGSSGCSPCSRGWWSSAASGCIATSRN
jgi:hypothetical protein